MRVVDFLRALRDGEPLSAADLRTFVSGVAAGTIPDYQATAFLMAVFLKGLSDELTVALTLAMRDSGSVLDLADIPGIKVDKHSTGGVGDKLSLPLAPLVAACGVPIPMISGRGLGHTGGTLDKLEAIPGFRVDLATERFKALVRRIGVCLIGQTGDIAPADKKLYALRDVTATVESVPLITASILSKKLAEGIDALVLDVKVGRGAFMKTEKDARRLAKSLVAVGTGAGLKVRALLTRMEEPLGRMIGNALEVRESIDILRGCGPKDTTELTFALGVEMLLLGKKATNAKAARTMLEAAVRSGAGLAKLEAIIEAQHGDPKVVADPERLPTARQRTPVGAANKGYLKAIDSFALGLAAMRLGAGRSKAEDEIDPAVGIELLHQVGDPVAKNEPMAVIHHNQPADVDAVRAAFSIAPRPGRRMPLVIDRLG
ncbi:MAG: thymidine phosphorylase [Deltaproteobacteria bacterium]|nr:thymidine phosphorylase [Deltaproteobacteria bacterium]